MDVLTPEQRQHNMSRIRGRDTKPEMLLRRQLHAAGLRFRLHASGLPGRPDMVFPRHRAAIFVHGCFWHGHNCPLFKLPSTRAEFWSAKISGNRDRDFRTIAALREAGWRVLIVWECSLKGPGRLTVAEAVDFCAAFVRGGARDAELTGVWPESTQTGAERRSPAE
ncbi:very short patch repair endonuclease [Rhodopila sp.]|jgi:DNA mismatch endonuclease (patch repair protein)|uniref:very short patch repair endonuclease n=1 Tax=Rhodopila sp. TaxID=2480087 RepID=UPI002C997EE6|nr:very short patch repair endonuclease [Rhodopila sp.]HVZ06567.1 very short patch repair endonuclease [Rhodopila sp.]